MDPEMRSHRKVNLYSPVGFYPIAIYPHCNQYDLELKD